MKIKYVGVYDCVDIPSMRIGGLLKNETIDVEDKEAEKLLQQSDNWQIVVEKPAATEPTKKGE